MIQKYELFFLKFVLKTSNRILYKKTRKNYTFVGKDFTKTILSNTLNVTPCSQGFD